MALGGGGSTPMPVAQPQTPVPQQDDPKGVEEQRKTALAAKGREGYSAHLLSDKGYDSALGSSDGPNTSATSKANMMG